VITITSLCSVVCSPHVCSLVISQSIVPLAISMFIKSTRQSENRRTCLCEKGGECKAISKAFRDLEDIRGGYAMAPSPVQDSRKGL